MHFDARFASATMFSSPLHAAASLDECCESHVFAFVLVDLLVALIMTLLLSALLELLVHPLFPEDLLLLIVEPLVSVGGTAHVVTSELIAPSLIAWHTVLRQIRHQCCLYVDLRIVSLGLRRRLHC